MSSVRRDLADRERMELEAVASAFERTPRIAKLLRYLGEKYFAGETDQLTEYNIAIEVFARNPNTFIASEDAIARVESYRLRKKLRAYYEAEGRDHAVQITIPPGSYSPVFSQFVVDGAADGEPGKKNEVVAEGERPIEVAVQEHPEAAPKLLSLKHLTLRKKWIYGVAIATGLILIIGLLVRMRTGRSVSNMAGAQQTFESRGAAQSGGAVSQLPLRMILGYFGPAQRDSAGEVWQADQFHTGGWSTPQPSAYITRTSDPFLFRYGRFGDFEYKIPLKPGSYELHLHTVSLASTPQSDDDQIKTVFRVDVNGQRMLDYFDPLSDAMGVNVADERVIRSVSPAKDGLLHLHVSTVIGTPFLSALEVLPGQPNKQLPIRLVMQNTSWTDHNGQFWHPDNYFQGGRRLLHTLPDAWAADTGIYLSERYGHFSYAIPVDPRDRYTVILHFAELFFGVSDSNASGAGERVFRVMCNGNTILDDFDIAREAGSARPLVKIFYHLKPTAQGKLNLTFEPIKNYATVSAIEVLDESN